MLTQRLMVAAIGLPILAAVIASPEPVFAAALEVILAIAAFELVRSAQTDEGELTAPVGAAAATAVLVALTRTGLGPSLWALLLPTVLALALLIRGRTTFGDSLTGWWLGAVLYLGVLGGHLVLLREVDEGQRWLLVLLGTVFATDTGAYAIGRLFGRHKMAPQISPKKTWEGAAGGFAKVWQVSRASVYGQAPAGKRRPISQDGERQGHTGGRRLLGCLVRSVQDVCTDL